MSRKLWVVHVSGSMEFSHFEAGEKYNRGERVSSAGFPTGFFANGERDWERKTRIGPSPKGC